MLVFGLKNNQKGYTIMSVSVTIGLTIVLTSILATLTINQLSSVRRSAVESQAYNMAKAGISAALEDLNTNSEETAGNIPVNSSQGFIDLDNSVNIIRGYKTTYNRTNNVLTSTGLIQAPGIKSEKTIYSKTEPDINTYSYKEFFNDSTYKNSLTSAVWQYGKLKLPYDCTWTPLTNFPTTALNGQTIDPTLPCMASRTNGRMMVGGTYYTGTWPNMSPNHWSEI